MLVAPAVCATMIRYVACNAARGGGSVAPNSKNKRRDQRLSRRVLSILPWRNLVTLVFVLLPLSFTQIK